MTKTPSMNTTNRPGSGWPSPASHSAHYTGQSSSQMPIGLSIRMSFA
jgi:hypothetical protein